MPIMANMTDLLNKIERDLGSDELGLKDEINKNTWPEKVIWKDTLDTFSRFFPRIFPYVLGPENKKNDYYLIDENICSNIKIIGAKDIDWRKWSAHYPGLLYGGVNSYDMMTSGIDFEGMVDVQMMADHVSAFANGIYVEFEEPNRIRLNVVVASSFLTNFQRIPINLNVRHARNLKTIGEGKMEYFEELAKADVAKFLYGKLKMYDGLQLTSTNIDLKIADLQQKASRREELIETFRNAMTTAANKSTPAFITIN